MTRNVRTDEPGFTKIPHTLSRDTRLSHGARGLAVQMLSHKDGYKSDAQTLAQYTADGRDAIRGFLAELRRYRYLVREKVQGPDGRITTKSALYDHPQEEPQAAPTGDPGERRSPTGGKPATRSDQGRFMRAEESPGAGNPPVGATRKDAEKPQVKPTRGKSATRRDQPKRDVSAGGADRRETRLQKEDQEKNREKEISQATRPHEDTRDRLRRLVPDDEIEQFTEHIKTTHTIRTTVGAYLTAWTDDQITDALAATRQQARQRELQRQRRAVRAAIDACPHCDPNGWRHDLDPDGKLDRCDHTPPRGPQKPPRPPEPRTEAQPPADPPEPPPAGVTPAQEAIARLREQKGWERKPLRGQGGTEPAERAQPPPATGMPDCPACGTLLEPDGACYQCAANVHTLTPKGITA